MNKKLNDGWDIPKRYLRLELSQDNKDNQKKNTLNWLTEDVRVNFDISAAGMCKLFAQPVKKKIK